MIPKIIHQIWIGHHRKPIEWMNTFSIDYIKHNPHYTYIEWNETNIKELFIGFNNYEKIYNLEKTFNGKSDLLRYLILYKYGGIYIDADSVWINNKSFDNFLNNKCFFAYENEKKLIICGGVMGTTKFNRFMKILIDKISNIELHKYKKMRANNDAWQVIGPQFITNNIDYTLTTIYDNIYFYPYDWHNIKDDKMHLKVILPIESITFQYGLTTNKLL